MKKKLLLFFATLMVAVTSFAAAPVTVDTIDVSCTLPSKKYYSADNDQYIVLCSADKLYCYYFDVICDQGEQDINIDQEYTFNDMIPDYTYGVNINTSTKISYNDVKLKRSADGSYDIVVVSTSGEIYHLIYETITQPKDTVNITIDNKLTTRVLDKVASSNVFQLYGSDANDEYFMYFAIQNTNSIPGTYTTDSVDPNYTILYHCTTSDTTEININNLLPNAVVSAGQTPGSYNATINYVGSDSILYAITFNYVNPAPTTQLTFNARNLTFEKNPIFDLYVQYFQVYPYDFTTQNKTHKLSGTIYSDVNSPCGTFESAGINTRIEYTLYDVVTGKIIGQVFSDSITIEQTANGDYTLGGRTLLYGDVQFTIKTVSAVTLDESTVTVDSIRALKGENINLKIGRTFIKDGQYNTVCLPFSLDAAQLAQSPLAGYSKLLEFTSAKVKNYGKSDETLVINMSETDAIQAGHPYIIEWDSIGDTIANPVFRNVTVTTEYATNKAQLDGAIMFFGTFTPFMVYENDMDFIFVDDKSQLSWPNKTNLFKAFRAYFQINKANPAGLRSGMNAIFGSDDEEGTTRVLDLNSSDDASKARKLMLEGRVVIERNGRYFDLTGKEMK